MDLKPEADAKVKVLHLQQKLYRWRICSNDNRTGGKPDDGKLSRPVWGAAGGNGALRLEKPRLLLTLRKPHVRFNEGPVETQFGWALPVYSTNAI